MGCGASASHTGDALKEVNASSSSSSREPEAFTWATPSENSPLQSSSAPGRAVVHDKGKSYSVVSESPDDESEIEIVYEGKPQQRELFGDDFDEIPEILDVKGKTVFPSSATTTILSKQQQEEAAKLAEQRKRFDNQRYQREQAAFNTTPSMAGTGASQTTAASNRPQWDGDNGGGDMVMGLNLTEPVERNQDMDEDCLPGGVANDTPRMGHPIKVVKNKHEMFDDDDEMLMKEILDETRAESI